MFIFACTYIIFYSLSLILVAAFFKVMLGVSFCFNIPLQTLVRLVRSYSFYFYVYVIFFLTLSGMPPLFLFFPKFYLINAGIANLSLYVAFLVGVYSLLTVVYYLQVFNITEKDFIFKKVIFNSIEISTVGLKKNSKYFFVLSVLWFLFLNLYGFFFGIDIFVSVVNLFSG